jgi:dihydrodipicolinate synthase/N-acetylneuraminate lyase
MAASDKYLLTGCTPALITPFLADGSGVNVEVIPSLVEMHIEAGVSGFYICGSTGEGAAMTVAERKAMAEATMAAVAGRAPVVTMVGNCPIDEAIELAKHAESIGISGLSSTVPKDKPKDLEAAVEYFTALGGATALPFYIYWIASTAAGDMTAPKYLEAVKGVPHLAGIKFTDSNFFLFQQLMALGEGVLGRPFNCVTGPDEMAVAGLAMGSHGAIGSTYNSQPKLNVAMHRAYAAGEVKLAAELQAKCNAMIALFFEHCDLLKGPGTKIIAGIKAIYRARGFDVGHSREASGVITEEQEKALLASIEALDWAVE